MVCQRRCVPFFGQQCLASQRLTAELPRCLRWISHRSLHTSHADLLDVCAFDEQEVTQVVELDDLQDRLSDLQNSFPRQADGMVAYIDPESLVQLRSLKSSKCNCGSVCDRRQTLVSATWFSRPEGTLW